MALKVAGLMCFILCVHGACLQVKPPTKEMEPARKLLAQAVASGPMNSAVINSETRKLRAPPLPPKLIMIIVPFIFTISAAIICIFRGRNPNSAEPSAAVPNNITCNCNFSIIGALF